MRKFALLSLFYLSLFLTAAAQFKNIKLDEQESANGYRGETSVAVNPRNPQNIVVVSVSNIYTTKDGGVTWQKINSSNGINDYPAVIPDAKGNFYFFHIGNPAIGSESSEAAQMVIQESTDGGITWSAAEQIIQHLQKDNRRTSPVLDNKGNLYLTWTQFDKYHDSDSNCLSHIFFSKSKNGKKWSNAIQISQMHGNCTDGDSTVRGAIPAVGFDGKIYIAWANSGKIYFDRSFDGGNMWLNNDLVIAQQSGGSSLEIPGYAQCSALPVLVTNNSKTPWMGGVYVAWADQRNGEKDTDIWFMRSTNAGDNWSSPQRVNSDLKGKHQFLPYMTVDQATGYVYIVYYDRSAYEDLQTDVYVAFSTDGGASFKNVKISETPFTPSFDSLSLDYINISAQKGIIVPVWIRADNGKTSVWTSVIKHEDLAKAVTPKK